MLHLIIFFKKQNIFPKYENSRKQDAIKGINSVTFKYSVHILIQKENIFIQFIIINFHN